MLACFAVCQLPLAEATSVSSVAMQLVECSELFACLLKVPKLNRAFSINNMYTLNARLTLLTPSEDPVRESPTCFEEVEIKRRKRKASTTWKLGVKT